MPPRGSARDDRAPAGCCRDLARRGIELVAQDAEIRIAGAVEHVPAVDRERGDLEDIAKGSAIADRRVASQREATGDAPCVGRHGKWFPPVAP